MDLAYCEELRRNVYIDEARLEYFALKSRYSEFHFVCSDPGCVQPDGRRTQVTATHYRTPPEEATGQSPTFRLYPNRKHTENCVWFDEQALAVRPRQPGESERQYQSRILNSKILDRIDIFERPSANPPEKAADSGSSTTNSEEKRSAAGCGGSGYGNAPRTTFRRTGLLESLVTCYLRNQEQKQQKKLTEEEFKQIGFTIPGEGRKQLCYFFMRLENAWNRQDFNGVYIAEVYDVRRFGTGFKLFLKSKINGKTPTLYIDKSLMDKDRYRNNFETVLDSFKRKEVGMKAYFMAPQFEEREKTLDIAIPSLRFLSLRLLGKKK